jgi:hypothetical protein
VQYPTRVLDKEPFWEPLRFPLPATLVTIAIQFEEINGGIKCLIFLEKAKSQF